MIHRGCRAGVKPFVTKKVSSYQFAVLNKWNYEPAVEQSYEAYDNIDWTSFGAIAKILSKKNRLTNINNNFVEAWMCYILNVMGRPFGANCNKLRHIYLTSVQLIGRVWTPSSILASI